LQEICDCALDNILGVVMILDEPQGQPVKSFAACAQQLVEF